LVSAGAGDEGVDVLQVVSGVDTVGLKLRQAEAAGEVIEID
jgi:hypothetical protein